MTATTVDEETPLLPEQQQKKPTPLPWAQFSIILVLQLAEPLTSQVIYPFAPQVCCIRCPAVIATHVRRQLIRDVGITHGDETRVGYYVGVMVRLLRPLSAARTLTQTLCSNQYSSRRRP